MNVILSSAFAVCGGIGAYFGWIRQRGQPARSYDLKESIAFILVAFALSFVFLWISSRRKRL
jgi:hypothetical protein